MVSAASLLTSTEPRSNVKSLAKRSMPRFESNVTSSGWAMARRSIGVPAGYSPTAFGGQCDALAVRGETAKHDKTTIYVGSQIPYGDRDQTAATLGKEPEEVRVVATLMGGGFGGKEDIVGQLF